jgi:hypothetical protein
MEFAIIVLPYKFVTFRLVGWIEETVIDDPTMVLDMTLLPVILENTMAPLVMVDPVSDERVAVLP